MTEQKNSPIDYLVVGHIAKDLTPAGYTLGGTAAYAARTAAAFGLRVGMLTSVSTDLDLSPLEGIEIITKPTDQSTTFENRYTSFGRSQILHACAAPLLAADIPPAWHNAPIVHLAPIAAEIDHEILEIFTDALLAMTPQGWLRRWDEQGKVHLASWSELIVHLENASAVVLSLEDLTGESQPGRSLAQYCEILAITEGAQGARVFWQGEERHFPAPDVEEIDPTGAGDIFAAVFFTQLFHKHTPWEAAILANSLAASSVTRRGLESTPLSDEVQRALSQVHS